MDRLDGVLREHQGHEAFVLRCEMASPWALRIADRSRLAVVIMISGSLTLRYEGDPADAAVRLGRGDVGIVRGDRPYRLGDDAQTEPRAVIAPGQVCRSLLDGPAEQQMGWHGRSWGNADPAIAGATVFLTGVYELRGQVSGRLLDRLPDVAVLPAPSCDPALVSLLTGELADERPGQAAILDRLVDLVLVSAVRAWFARPDVDPPAWWSAQDDALVGPVLALMHEQPAQAWSLAALAAEIGWSRATLARRFVALMGESPMAYLTRWRLELAADLLAGGTDTVETVAGRVGYQNAFAFSTAFKRAHGVSPRAYRAAATPPRSATG